MAGKGVSLWSFLERIPSFWSCFTSLVGMMKVRMSARTYQDKWVGSTVDKQFLWKDPAFSRPWLELITAHEEKRITAKAVETMFWVRYRALPHIHLFPWGLVLQCFNFLHAFCATCARHFVQLLIYIVDSCTLDAWSLVAVWIWWDLVPYWST